MEHHLAQLNIGITREPLDAPPLRGFVEALDPVNAAADAAPEFVWRLQTEDGDATALRPYADTRILINLSVWTDLAALRAYVYRSPHATVMRRRRDWFERFDRVYVALWWVPKGHRPTVTEAVARLAHLERHGPTEHSFTFAEPFEASGHPVPREDVPRGDACPAT